MLEEKNFCQSGESIFSATHNSKEKVMIHSFYKICELVDFHPYSENYWRIYAGWVTSQKCEAHIELSMVESDCVQELAGITWELNSDSAGESGQKFLGQIDVRREKGDGSDPGPTPTFFPLHSKRPPPTLH